MCVCVCVCVCLGVCVCVYVCVCVCVCVCMWVSGVMSLVQRNCKHNPPQNDHLFTSDYKVCPILECWNVPCNDDCVSEGGRIIRNVGLSI